MVSYLPDTWGYNEDETMQMYDRLGWTTDANDYTAYSVPETTQSYTFYEPQAPTLTTQPTYASDPIAESGMGINMVGQPAPAPGDMAITSDPAAQTGVSPTGPIAAGPDQIAPYIPAYDQSGFVDQAQADAFGRFSTSPDYLFRFNEGQRALDSGAAARGMLMSGKQLKEMQRFGQNLASGEYGNYMNRLMTLSGFQPQSPYGMAAGGAGQAFGNMFNAAGSLGTNLGNIYGSQGNMNAYNASQPNWYDPLIGQATQGITNWAGNNLFGGGDVTPFKGSPVGDWSNWGKF